MAAWHEVVSAVPGSTITQGAAERYCASGFVDFAAMPGVDEYTLDTPGGWARVDADGDVDVTGRLIGGCLETVSHLAGTPLRGRRQLRPRPRARRVDRLHGIGPVGRR